MNMIRFKTLHFLAAASGLLLVVLTILGLVTPQVLSIPLFSKLGIALFEVSRIDFIALFVCIGFIFLMPHWVIALFLPLYTGLLLMGNVDSGFHRLIFILSTTFMVHPYFAKNGGYLVIEKISYFVMALLSVFFFTQYDASSMGISMLQPIVLNLCVIGVLGLFLGVTLGTNLASLTLGFCMIASASLAYAMHPFLFAVFTIFYLWSIASSALQDRLRAPKQ